MEEIYNKVADTWNSVSLSSKKNEQLLLDKLSSLISSMVERAASKKLSSLDLTDQESIKDLLTTCAIMLKDKIDSSGFLDSQPSGDMPEHSTMYLAILNSHLERLYIYFVKNMDMCKETLKRYNLKVEILTFSEFKAELRNFFLKLDLILDKEDFDLQVTEFTRNFIAIENRILGKEILKKHTSSFNESLQNCKKFYTRMETILTEAFRMVTDYTISTREALEPYTEEYKIIEAVEQTLNIKIDTMRESIEVFLEELEQINIEEKIPDNLKVNAYEQWIQEVNIATVESAKNFFEQLVKQNEEALAGWINKNLIKRKEVLHKQDLNFKKNHLLFEVTTFNELLNHSISRLKETEHMDILMYIQMVEEANSLINSTLVKYEIRPIEPLEREIFNAKEHEVIVTEKHDDYKKGEIIRTSNHGYKQGNDVIIRANVIVAR